MPVAPPITQLPRHFHFLILMVGVLASVKACLDYERAQWTGDSVEDEVFYQTTPYSLQDKPGKVLKVEEITDTTPYLLPPGISMSRFIYLSETVHGSPVPVSAYVLWPFSPRTHAGKLPIVAWAHGTSGIGRDAAPSHYKNLWQHFLAPYPLVLSGYVVVATDYAGLGVVRACPPDASGGASGDPIVHPYLCSASHALDVVLSVQAAQSIFPTLSRDFVTIGHSQGGCTAWAVAERQAKSPIPGCLGCVAVSPPIRFLEEEEPFRSIITAAVSDGVKSIIPTTDVGAFLTPTAQERTALIRESKAGVAATVAMLLGVDLVQPEFKNDLNLSEYAELSAVGGRPIGCPLLIIHGIADPKISAAASRRAARRTGDMFPRAYLEYIGLSGITHDPAMTAGQSTWMEWIAARFDGKVLQPGFTETTVEPARPSASYHPEVNWYLAPASEPYQVP